MYSPEFRLLSLACSFRASNSDVSTARLIAGKENPDWDDLFARASFHRIEPQVLHFMENHMASLVPESTMERFREIVQANLVRQLRFISEFFSIREWLAAEGIEVVPFKGFWLGESEYGNVGERMSSDIDLFINQKDLDYIKRIMFSKGYVGHEAMDKLTDEYIRKEMAEYNFGRYDDDLRVAHVEFHWRSAMSFYDMNISFDDLRLQMSKELLQGHEINVFSPSANLLLLVMHHGGKECYWQLRQILDIAHILRNNPDIDASWLLFQAEKYHLTTLLFMGVRLAHEITGVDIPDFLTCRTSARRIDSMIRSRTRLMAQPVRNLDGYKERVASWLFRIRSRDSIGTKKILAVHTIRKVMAPRLVPEQWRHYFFNQKIRRVTVD
jgi:hypothetical protein